MFDLAKDVIERCKKENKKIWEVTLELELEKEKMDERELFSKLEKTYDIMKSSIKKGLEKETISVSGMTGGNAKKMYDHDKTNSICGKFIMDAMTYGVAVSEVNASMGKIVAAPTAGSAGIIPAVFLSIQEKYGFSDLDMQKALLTAGTVGGIIAKNATISGAEGGCQAECGAASAMAAAACAELLGADVETCFSAAGFTIINVLGLVCDPIGGLVEFPCSLRNASGVTNALISIDLAMNGFINLIPFDEVVGALFAVGCSLPDSLRETGYGGIAGTPKACHLRGCYIK